MKFPRLLFFHAALVLAGWGIVAALEPRPVTEQAVASTKTSARDERARREGEEILRQMEAALPAPGQQVTFSPKEGTYEQRLREWAATRPISRAIVVGFAQTEIFGFVRGEGSPELTYAFLHQRMEAHEILALLYREFPEHGKNHVLDEALFGLLGPIDPGRAVELLDSLPPEDRDQALLNLATDTCDGSHPEIWREVAELNSASSDLLWLGQRKGFWDYAAAENLETFGDNYLPWVLDLPPGADREDAIHATAAKLKEIDPAAAERFLKVAKSRPAGDR